MLELPRSRTRMPALKPEGEEPATRLLREPVLAQIPLGAPGYGYWTAVGILIWLASFSVLIPLYREFAPEFPRVGSNILANLHSPSAKVVLLGGAASLVIPLILHHWLRGQTMRSYGAVVRVLQRGVCWFHYSDRPLGRRQAIVTLLGPLAAVTSLGLAAMVMHWAWAMLLVAFEWARFAPDAALGFRLLREPGCTLVHFRRDGVVLYGTGRAPSRQTPARLWLTNLVLCAGWAALAVFILSGFSDAPSIAALIVLLVVSAPLAALRVRRLRRRDEAQHRVRLKTEVDEAREMQRSLLPTGAPKAAGIEIFALFEAAHEVSGDFYLFPSAPPGTVRLVLGDVAGKGLPSALTAALAVGFLQGGSEAAPDPAALLAGAERSLRAARNGRMLVATCGVELELESRRVRWSNAGLPPPALLREGAVTWLPGTGIPLGSLPHVEYHCHQDHLRGGDLLLLYTDGLVEATSLLGELFGRERLAAALRRLPAGCSAGEALRRLQTEITHFIGDAEPYDDITAMALRVE